MKNWTYSNKLSGVRYDIRGKVLQEAYALERSGVSVLKLNIGNTMPFGLEGAKEILQVVQERVKDSQGYEYSKGILPAREAIVHYYQQKDIAIDIENIYVGNGVSELISMSMQTLLNPGDQVLIPAPDYPLWTAAATLSGGTVTHYLCDESNDWQPDVEHIKKCITKNTKALVLINPNNPTGAVYSKEILTEIVKLCIEHGIMIFSDEIYEKVLYDDALMYNTATFTGDYPCIFFGGLSKIYRLPGFRSGWMCIKDPRGQLINYKQGLEVLSNMRLCSNVPSQHAIPIALNGYQDIEDLTRPNGRLYEQKKKMAEILSTIPGLSFTEPKGALYAFPKIDVEQFNIKDDEKFVLDFLKSKHILFTHGRAFNWKDPDHFRIVFLPNPQEIERAMLALKEFLLDYKQE